MFSFDFCNHRRRDAKGGLPEQSDCVLEIDQSRLIRFIQDGKRACNPKPSANGFLAARLIIDEHHICIQLGRKHDGLALARVEFLQDEATRGTDDFHPGGSIRGPFPYRFRRQGMLELSEHSGRDQDSRV